MNGGVLMNKEEILDKSRKENKNQDAYEKYVIMKGSKYGCITAVILATVFLVI